VGLGWADPAHDQPRESIAAAISSVAASGIVVAAFFHHEQPGFGDLARARFAIADREKRLRLP